MSDTTAVKSNVFVEDLALATGGTGAVETGTRKTSTGGSVTLTKIDASHIKFLTFLGSVDSLLNGDYSITLKLKESIIKAPEVDARAYGTAGTQAAIIAALADIGSKQKTLVLYPSLADTSTTWSITADQIISANVTLKVSHGAILGIATGKTLTINSTPDAGLYQIFSCTGTGKVVLPLSTTAYPQWWGAVGNGTTNDAVAIQAAITSGAGTVYCPTQTATTFGSATIATGTYALGTTQLSINRPFRFIMPLDGAFTYTGATGPFLIDLSSANYISGLEFNVGSIKSTGSYCISINAADSDGQLERSIVKVGWLEGYTGYGVKVDTGGAYNKFDIRQCRAKQPVGTAELAYAFYYSLTHIAGAAFEANEITIGSVYNQKGIYGDAYFKYNQVDIDYDGGTQGEANKIDVAGVGNTFKVRALTGTLAAKTDSIRIRSTATLNNFIGSNYYLMGILDEAGIGSSNTFPATPGIQNLLKNPSFESWGCLNGGTYAPTDWDTSNNITYAQEQTERRHGQYSIKITSTSSYAQIAQALPAIAIGKAVTVSGWFMAPVTNVESTAVYLVDSTSTSLGVDVPKDGKWRFLSTTVTFTGVSPYLRIYCNDTANVTAGEILYIDGLTVNLGLNNPVFPEPITNRVLFAEAPISETINATSLGVGVLIHCLGAAMGDPVVVSCTDADGAILNLFYSAHVYVADHVRVSIANHSAGNTTISGTLRVAVMKNGF